MCEKKELFTNKKISIGSAQFGMDYGVSNLNGKVTFQEVESILEFSKKAKIRLIDTAISYGKSEDILGKIGISNFQIVSKLPKIPDNVDPHSWIIKQVEGSINRLKIEQLYCLLLHQPTDLKGPYLNVISEALNFLKSSGLVTKIGASIYRPEDLDDIYPLINLDVIQSPMNIVDRRLEKSGWLAKLHKDGVEIHARSVFLQGLLLMQRNKIPLKFEKWSFIWDKWNYELDKRKLNSIAECLAYPSCLNEIDRVIVGVNSLFQLKNIISASKIEPSNQNWSFMISNDDKLINPSNWSSI